MTAAVSKTINQHVSWTFIRYFTVVISSLHGPFSWTLAIVPANVLDNIVPRYYT